MKKSMTTLLLLSLLSTSVAYAVQPGFTSEKEIGPCTQRNKYGRCVGSKTHTCYDTDYSTGLCKTWVIRNGDQYNDLMRQYYTWQRITINGESLPVAKKNVKDYMSKDHVIKPAAKPVAKTVAQAPQPKSSEMETFSDVDQATSDYVAPAQQVYVQPQQQPTALDSTVNTLNQVQGLYRMFKGGW